MVIRARANLSPIHFLRFAINNPKILHRMTTKYCRTRRTNGTQHSHAILHTMYYLPTCSRNFSKLTKTKTNNPGTSKTFRDTKFPKKKLKNVLILKIKISPPTSIQNISKPRIRDLAGTRPDLKKKRIFFGQVQMFLYECNVTCVKPICKSQI